MFHETVKAWKAKRFPGFLNLDAMGRLTRGAPGPGYAGGGYVQSNPAAMALQLASMGPMAMQQFHQVMSNAMRVYLDGRDISANSARNYAQQTAIGAN